MTVWLALVVRSVATLAVTLGMVACLQRRSAALRHWVLAAGIFGAAVVVPCSLAFQVFDISLASPWTLPGEAVGGPVSVAVATTAQAAPGASVWGGVSPIVILWSWGFVAVGMALLVSVVRLRRNRCAGDAHCRPSMGSRRVGGVGRIRASASCHRAGDGIAGPAGDLGISAAVRPRASSRAGLVRGSHPRRPLPRTGARAPARLGDPHVRGIPEGRALVQSADLDCLQAPPARRRAGL